MVKYYCLDILENHAMVPDFDYIVLNGVLTEKVGLSFEEMLSYSMRLLELLFRKANIGIAFNVMSAHVDWKRDDLFHLPFDTLTHFLSQRGYRNFIIRNDYGLYEYTTYLYKGI